MFDSLCRALLLSPVLALLCACSESSPPPTTEQAVTVVTLQAQAVTLTRELPGRTTPFLVAEVRPQATGIVLDQLFTEGSLVEAGQSLYQLDDASYRARYNSSRASLTRAQVALEVARTNASRTTISYAVPENDVLVWRVAPRMKDGAKVEVLPRDSALLPVRARQAIVKLLEILSPGADLEPDRRFMIPMHNLAEPKVMKQFLSLLDVATKTARKLKRAA